ncbi:SUMF1/EgtB/PvdO family nonheme iron enzyme [Stieleria varia]|uniref:Formylglycine-generating sulfatase enzyme n=1 Tax=Stieleria varia TaxID=2528005 RepID=A0A5C5ZNU4_9BACT|nr:SUMF1/EgtB/PvdO family nonheme iron enzyme [Stieleria varia]TWT89172.1 Formylglycine-generating sulfatase enzyme [Stieleria varia]
MKFGKFIRDQRLCRLAFPAKNACPLKDYIDALGSNPTQDPNGQSEPVLRYDPSLWPDEPNRHAFLQDLSIRRLCVTVEGGVGKSKLLEELEVATENAEPGHIALRFELRQLPESAEQFAHRSGPSHTSHSTLFEKLLAQYGAIREKHYRATWRFPSDPEIEQQLFHALRTGSLTLIVDAFDQLNRQEAEKRAAALNSFVTDYFPGIRLVIAGRPYAIKRVWDELQLGELKDAPKELQDEEMRQIPVWTFCKVEKFSRDQADEYLSAEGGTTEGKKKLDALKRMDAEEIRLPRTLNIIRELKPGELAHMQTASDLYWYSMNETVIANFRNSTKDSELRYLKRSHVIPIVSAVAFAMITWKEDPVDCVPSITSDSARNFFDYMEEFGFIAVLKELGIDFEKELLDLAQIDSESIQFHFYSETTSIERPDEVVDVRMSDVTIRDFFAAHWAACYWADQCQVLRSRELSLLSFSERDPRQRVTKDLNSPDFAKFWRFVVGMPDRSPKRVHSGNAATEDSWATAVRPLFTTKDQARPTELMFQCLPDLMWRSGYQEARDHSDRSDWNQTTTAQAITIAQREVRDLFERQNPEEGGPARKLVFEFLTDYLLKLADEKERGTTDCNVTFEMRRAFYLDCEFTPINPEMIYARTREDESLRISRLTYLAEHYPLWLFERNFRAIQGGPFLYGDSPDPNHPLFVESFQLNAYCVSDTLYQVFDGQIQPVDGSAKSLRWCDAQLFAVWAHGCLPDEHLWEAACRGNIGNLDLQKHTVYGFGNNEELLELHAHFEKSNSEWNDNADLWSTNSVSVPGQLLPTTSAELYDMHGLVWEWCSNGISRPVSVSNHEGLDFVNPLFQDAFAVVLGRTIECWETERWLRGGSYYEPPSDVSCTSRMVVDQDLLRCDYGCRIARNSARECL